MLRTRPFATIVVPTLGRQSLTRALASLLRQTETSWEAIVVDDSGEGRGIRLAESVGDERIRALASPGSGQVDARNAALAAASGSIACWLDDDDWWDDPQHLELLRRTVRDGAFYYRGGWVVRTADGGRDVFDLGATCRSLRSNNTILTSSFAYPLELHADLGFLDASLGGYCDWDLMLRFCGAGLQPAKVPGLGVCYAVHDENVSTAYDAPQRRLGFDRLVAKHQLTARIANHVIIQREMSGLPDGWAEVDGALEREFELPDFPAAIAFVNRVAELAEREDHHPDIRISYRRVTLRWWTHTAGGVTDRDRELAARSGELAD